MCTGWDYAWTGVDGVLVSHAMNSRVNLQSLPSPVVVAYTSLAMEADRRGVVVDAFDTLSRWGQDEYSTFIVNELVRAHFLEADGSSVRLVWWGTAGEMLRTFLILCEMNSEQAAAEMADWYDEGVIAPGDVDLFVENRLDDARKQKALITWSLNRFDVEGDYSEHVARIARIHANFLPGGLMREGAMRLGGARAPHLRPVPDES